MTRTLAWRWGQLLFAFALVAVAIALMLRSGLGLGPWDAFHQGLHELTGITVGTASIVAGLAVLAGSMLIGVRPGVGTVANMVLIGLFVDLALPLTPAAPGPVWAFAYYAAALPICGISTGMYIGARLGSGPRDGLMLALSARFGWPVRRVRLALELAVLALGWLMGATVGLGTVFFAVAIGPAVQWGLHLFGVLPAHEEAARAGAANPRGPGARLDEAA